MLHNYNLTWWELIWELTQPTLKHNSCCHHKQPFDMENRLNCKDLIRLWTKLKPFRDENWTYALILTPEVYLSIVLVDATRCIVNFEIEIWRDALESKSFQSIDKDEGIIRFDSQGIPKSECFQNLG